MKVYFILTLLFIFSLASIPVKSESNYVEFYLSSNSLYKSPYPGFNTTSTSSLYKSPYPINKNLTENINGTKSTMLWLCDDDDDDCWEREYPDVYW